MKIDSLTNMATCWRMQLSNGKLLCFTDADIELLIDQEIYICGSYFTPSNIVSSNELAQDNFTIAGIIDDKIFTQKSLLIGDLSGSYLEFF